VLRCGCVKQADAKIKQRSVYNWAMKVQPSAEEVSFSFNSVFVGGTRICHVHRYLLYVITKNLCQKYNKHWHHVIPFYHFYVVKASFMSSSSLHFPVPTHIQHQREVSVTILSSVNARTQVQKLSSFQSLESLPQFQITTWTSSFVFRPATQFPLPQLLLIPTFYLTTLFFKVLPPTSPPQHSLVFTHFSLPVHNAFLRKCDESSLELSCLICKELHLVSTNLTPVIFIQVA